MNGPGANRNGAANGGVDFEVDVVVDVVVWVDVVLVTDSLGLFRFLIVSLQNDHTNRFIRNKRNQR